MTSTMTSPRPDLGGPPAVAPLSQGVDRPFWSVMMPTYNASGLLETALRSVLDQDPGPDRMQVAVVDDRSPNGEAERIVARLAPGRVEFHPNPANLGLAGNWNRCIELARGHWLHLFHQDDLIFPGFYDRLGRAATERPDAGAAFCRHIIMDGDGHWLALSEIERREPGILDVWLAKIARRQRIQCPSIVVRRDVYERLGGYRPDLRMALDWEMWVRIAADAPVWFEPQPLACWRDHGTNESSKLDREGAISLDILKAIGIVEDYLPADYRGAVGRDVLAEYRDSKLRAAYSKMHSGDWRAGLGRYREACAFDPSLGRGRARRDFWKWTLKLRLGELLSGPKFEGRGIGES